MGDGMARIERPFNRALSLSSRTNAAAIADARDGMSVEQHGDRSYLIRFPFVNVAAFDTDDGLVLVDAGFAPAGPALLEACTSR